MRKITLIHPGNALQLLEALSSSFAMGRMPVVLKISRTFKPGKRTKQSMNLLMNIVRVNPRVYVLDVCTDGGIKHDIYRLRVQSVSG